MSGKKTQRVDVRLTQRCFDPEENWFLGVPQAVRCVDLSTVHREGQGFTGQYVLESCNWTCVCAIYLPLVQFCACHIHKAATQKQRTRKTNARCKSNIDYVDRELQKSPSPSKAFHARAPTPGFLSNCSSTRRIQGVLFGF